jgi:hypothetical protein
MPKLSHGGRRMVAPQSAVLDPLVAQTMAGGLGRRLPAFRMLAAHVSAVVEGLLPLLLLLLLKGVVKTWQGRTLALVWAC